MLTKLILILLLQVKDILEVFNGRPFERGQSAPFSKAGSGSDESPDRIKIMEVLPPIDQPKKKFTPAKAKLSPK